MDGYRNIVVEIGRLSAMDPMTFSIIRHRLFRIDRRGGDHAEARFRQRHHQ